MVKKVKWYEFEISEYVISERTPTLRITKTYLVNSRYSMKLEAMVRAQDAAFRLFHKAPLGQLIDNELEWLIKEGKAFAR